MVEGRVALTAPLLSFVHASMKGKGGGATETLQVYLVNYTCKHSRTDSLSGRFWDGFLNESNDPRSGISRSTYEVDTCE